MIDPTYKDFQIAVDYILSKSILILSQSKAGAGFKELTYTPSTRMYTVEGDKNFRHLTQSSKEAYQIYINIKL